jgi:hypothetical protein
MTPLVATSKKWLLLEKFHLVCMLGLFYAIINCTRLDKILIAVHLLADEHGLDFSQYGILIKVKFR